MTEDEMVGWHHRLNGHEFEQAPGVGDGQGIFPLVVLQFLQPSRKLSHECFFSGTLLFGCTCSISDPT